MASPASASISMASSAAAASSFRRRLCRLPPPFSSPLRSSLRPSTAHFQPTSSSSARPFDLLFNRPHQSTEDAPENNNNNNQEELFDDISEDSPPSAAPMAERWREYHGSDDWRGLLDPLDEQMRGEIVKYGDLAQLTYDVFDPKTRRCLVKEEDLLKGHRGGYRVTKYIYAKPDVHVMPEWLRKWRHKEGHSHDEEDEEEEEEEDDDARLCWMGFVAVTEDEGEMERIGRRDIVVAWRGTVTQEEWLEDMDGALVHWRRSGGGGGGGAGEEEEEVGVERGFWTLYASGGEHSARQQVNGEVQRLVAEFGGGDRSLSITVTGHSLGGALALLSAYDVAAAEEAAPPVSVISFAAPRVGNEAFKRRLEEERGVRVLRVVNAHDIVPKVPGILAHDYDQEENGLEEICDDIVDKLLHVAHPTYIHVGTSLHLDNLHSPFLKHSTNLADTHNLEVYLHLLDAFRSSQEPFVGTPSHPNSFSSAIHRLLHISSSLLSRDIALVNKTSALLLDELRVPPYWWTHRSSSSLDS